MDPEPERDGPADDEEFSYQQQQSRYDAALANVIKDVSDLRARVDNLEAGVTTDPNQAADPNLQTEQPAPADEEGDPPLGHPAAEGWSSDAPEASAENA